MGFINAMLAIADPGDEVILPVPYYFNHEMAVVMVGAHAGDRADDGRTISSIWTRSRPRSRRARARS